VAKFCIHTHIHVYMCKQRQQQGNNPRLPASSTSSSKNSIMCKVRMKFTLFCKHIWPSYGSGTFVWYTCAQLRSNYVGFWCSISLLLVPVVCVLLVCHWTCVCSTRVSHTWLSHVTQDTCAVLQCVAVSNLCFSALSDITCVAVSHVLQRVTVCCSALQYSCVKLVSHIVLSRSLHMLLRQ